LGDGKRRSELQVSVKFVYAQVTTCGWDDDSSDLVMANDDVQSRRPGDESRAGAHEARQRWANEV